MHTPRRDERAAALRETFRAAGVDHLRIEAGSDYVRRPDRVPAHSRERGIEMQPGDDMRDTLAAEQLPVVEFPWVEVVSSLVVAIVIALIVALLAEASPAKPVESNEAVARRRLDALAASAAPDARAFHAELADILVRYVEASLGLPSTRLTSSEILRAFRRHGRMSAEWQCGLEELLAECDRAKFAPAFDAEWDPAASARRGREVLDALAVQVAAAPRLSSPWEGLRDAAV